MPVNRIDATLTPAQRTNIATAVGAIRTNLPFLFGLTPEERRRLSKMGPESQAFAETTLDLARQNPDILPASFPLTDFEEDLALYDAMEEVFLAIQSLYEEIRDTRTQAGSEAWAAARAIYYYAQGSVVGGQLDDALQQLGLRFARRRPSPPSA